MRRVGVALAFILLALSQAQASFEGECSYNEEIIHSFGSEDGAVMGLLLNYTIFSQVSELPNNITLLVPNRLAWLDFFTALGFKSITAGLQAASKQPKLHGLINSVMLYQLVVSPSPVLTTTPVNIPVLTGLVNTPAALYYANGTEVAPTSAAGPISAAVVLDEGDACGVPLLLTDAVILPSALTQIPITPSSDVPAALEVLGQEAVEESPRETGTSPPPMSPSPSGGPSPAPSCPYPTWEAAQADYPDLQVLTGLLALGNYSSTVIGVPSDQTTLLLPSSSGMLNALHFLEVGDSDALDFINAVPAIASYLVLPQALSLAELNPTEQVQTMLTTLANASYPVTFRVSTSTLTVPNQVRGNYNSAFILSTVKICNSWVFQLDKTPLPGWSLAKMPTVTFPSST